MNIDLTKIEVIEVAVMYPYLDTYTTDEVKQSGYDCLVALLHKIGVSTASKELRLYVPTLRRIMDAALPIESISYLTAAYIIFMCETNVKILRILAAHPRGTAYYKRGK